jgi:hypothetical protein
MSPPPGREDLRGDALRAGVQAALGGRPAALEDLLCRHGGGHDRSPNLRLAAAFGAEIAGAAAPAGAAARLLARFGEDDAAPDTPRVFLPIAAAHGWVAQLRAKRDAREGWPALAELAADERAPVRAGTREALLAYAAHAGGARRLVAEATGWLALEDPERRFGAAALVVEVLADRRALAAAGDPAPLLEYLSGAIAAAADATRSAERSDARRRLLQALPRTLAAAVAAFAAGDRGAAFLEAECAAARRPDVRDALSGAIRSLTSTTEGTSAVVAERLRAALSGSAKPPRDPTRIRPGAGRGRATRRIR